MLPIRELASPKAMTEGCFKAVIKPFTLNAVTNGFNRAFSSYKTASGNLAFHRSGKKNRSTTKTSNKTASGNPAFNFICCYDCMVCI